jgi:peptide/nickel transport system permease protein
LTTDAEERVAVATQAQLMWRRFRKHRLAMVGAVVVILFYLGVLLADFLSYADPEASDAQRGLIAPQRVHLFLDGQFRPHVYAMVGERDPATFKRVYTEIPPRSSR